MQRLLMAGLVAGAAMAASAVQIIVPKDANINYYATEEDTWQSDAICNPKKQDPLSFEPSGEDFFTLEFGRPMDFSDGRDCLREFGAEVTGAYAIRDGALEISGDGTGEFGFSFKDLSFGQQWGNALSQPGYLELELEHGAVTSVWEFAADSHWHKGTMKRKGRIVSTGKGMHRVLGRAFNANGGPNCRQIGVFCLKPEGTVRVKRIALRPFGAHVYYRRRFTLDFAPDEAKLSYLIASLDNYELTVNGHDLARPTGNMKSVEVMHENVARYLRKGENVIAARIRYNVIYTFICGFEDKTRLLLDLFMSDRTGRQAFLKADPTWKTAYGPVPDGWRGVAFDDSSWIPAGRSEKFARLTNGTRAALGLNPQHMGFLTTRPVGTKYPVFASDSSTPRRFAARFPAGLSNATLAVSMRHADTGDAVRLTPVEVAPKDGYRRFVCTLDGTRPGPYFLDWRLTADGVDEAREDEAILVGRIEQEMFPPETFEREFRKRLELVREIDPIREHEIGESFTCAAGRKDAYAKTEVVETNGLRYLSLTWDGPSRGTYDWMGWKIDTPCLGDAYHVEIDVPDDADRTVNACVLHSVGATYDNCHPPIGSQAEIAASAAITTGGIQKPSGGKKTLTLFFYAANKVSSVVIEQHFREQSPAPAAVCGIRVYHLKDGRLPGLALPPTSRRIMEHHERFTTWQTLASCDNMVERGNFHPNAYHRHAWTHWYHAIERKIRQLRFQGQNASIEGILMYDQSLAPSDTCLNSPHRGRDFDVPYLLSWMYDANGIDCYFGWEQNRLYCTRTGGTERGVSDRKVKAGLDRGIYSVDTNGNQVVSYADSCVNFLAKGVREDSYRSIRELYERYAKDGHVKGFFYAHGFFWTPGYMQPDSVHNDPLMLSYDDDTIECFERDTGIRLGTGTTGAARFRRRGELLLGRYRETFLKWRVEKMGEWFRDVNAILSSGEHAWPLMLSPNFSHGYERRDHDIVRQMYESGWTPKYKGLEDAAYFLPLGINPYWKWGAPAAQRDWSAFLESDEVQRLIPQARGVYAAYMLAESNLYQWKTDARWWWRGHSALCRYQRPAGRLAYLRERQICRNHVPQALVIAGVDCNPYTGQAEECRRFAVEFYKGKVNAE